MPSCVTHVLARVNFPLYTVHCLSENLILVAGGGGSSKTGISNVIEIYELVDNGSCAKRLAHYDTGTAAAMNCTVYDVGNHSIVFAGLDGECHVFKIKSKACHKSYSKKINNRSVAGKRSLKHNDNRHSEDSLTPHVFNIKLLKSFQTDFSKDPFQKLVKFSSVHKLLATAGADGCIRVWEYPDLDILHEIQAHDDDVDDIDFCPHGKKIVSVSRDGCGKVWDITNGKPISTLSYSLLLKPKVKYIFRSCRFSVIQNNKVSTLFATLNPAVRAKTSSPSFLCKWDAKDFVMEKIASVGKDMPSVMAVSGDGLIVGLGTQAGNLKLFDALNLKLLHSINNVHTIFVTGLDFVPISERPHHKDDDQMYSLISISVDNHINIHQIPVKNTPIIGIFSITMMMFMIFLFIFIFWDWSIETLFRWFRVFSNFTNFL